MPALWTFQPDWKSSVTVTPEYRTDIIVSRSGREQRRALRTTPRKTIGFSVTLAHDDLRRFTGFLRTSQNQSVVIGDPSRSVRADPATATDSTIHLPDEPPSWIYPGAPLLFDGGIQRTVTTIAGNSVNLNIAIGTAFPLGVTIRPALTGRIGASITATAQTNAVATATISFRVDPGKEPVDQGAVGVFLHNGREVFAFNPNWGSPPQFQFNWDTEDIDFGFGRSASYRPIQFGTTIRQAQFVRKNVDEIKELQRFFARAKGRRGEFYVPSGLADLVPLGATATGFATIRVAGRAYVSDTVQRALCIRTHDGRLIFRTIVGYAASGNDTIVTVSRPWLVDTTPDEIAGISLMSVCRFASDGLTVEFLTNSVAQAQVSLQSIQDLPPEGTVPIYDEATQWVLEAWGVGALGGPDALRRLVNIDYAAIFFIPDAWVAHSQSATDLFSYLINTRYSEVTT